MTTRQLESSKQQPPKNEKLQVLLSIWLKDLGTSGTQSLKETMDEIGSKASARGLTPEILDEILEKN